jgi:hypothetical protein
MGWVSHPDPDMVYGILFLLTPTQVEKTNMAMARSFIGRRFRLEFSGHRLEKKGTRFLTEVRAGLATFFAMAYIISVNASITSGSSSLKISNLSGF